ncbi:MAG: DNA polymerase IV [Treponemataceae bacterium]|nr:MAG: DNA polymerase IV [Treponemataceae bacterium]
MDFLHADIDAFFASVEQLDHPEYRGKPVIVGSLPTDKRGVVSTCSYEARKFGVHSAMPIFKAYALCPRGIFLRHRMKRYQEKSTEVMQIFNEFSPDVQQMSVDEAFIDLTGTERLFGEPPQTALRIKKEILSRTGLTISCGLATNKYIAKIASGISKPDGFYHVPPGREELFMLSLPLDKLWGCGAKSQKRLNDAGFKTIADIHKASLELLCSIVGEAGGSFLYKAVRGGDAALFSGETKNHSISAERTFDTDILDRTVAETALMELCHTVLFRLRSGDMTSKTVAVKIRYSDFRTVSVQETRLRNILSLEDLFERTLKVFRQKDSASSTASKTEGIRLLGLSVMNVSKNTDAAQGDLFDFDDKKKAAVEKTILAMQKKHIAVKKARTLKEEHDTQAEG